MSIHYRFTRTLCTANPYPAVFILFYQPTKFMLFVMKYVFKHQYLQIIVLKLNKYV